MKHTIYNEAKKLLISEAKKLKKTSDDKGYIRYEINNQADQISKQFYFYAMREVISTKTAALYSTWIHSLAADLQPK